MSFGGVRGLDLFVRDLELCFRSHASVCKGSVRVCITYIHAEGEPSVFGVLGLFGPGSKYAGCVYIYICICMYVCMYIYYIYHILVDGMFEKSLWV